MYFLGYIDFGQFVRRFSSLTSSLWLPTAPRALGLTRRALKAHQSAKPFDNSNGFAIYLPAKCSFPLSHSNSSLQCNNTISLIITDFDKNMSCYCSRFGIQYIHYSKIGSRWLYVKFYFSKRSGKKVECIPSARINTM